MPISTAKIHKKLYLALPLYRDDDGGAEVLYAHVHAAPVSVDVWEANFMLLSQTFTEIYARGLGDITGPRVAYLVMKEVAKRTGAEESLVAFMNEVRRLANVVILNGDKWESLQYTDALPLIDPSDLSEVENAIVFFTVSSALHKRNVLQKLLDGAVKLWGAQITSSDFTAFRNSLKISIETENTGEKKMRASSVPH